MLIVGIILQKKLTVTISTVYNIGFGLLIQRLRVNEDFYDLLA